MEINKDKLKEAAYDLRFLLNRGYRKKNALTFVANKYVLFKHERNYLARSIFRDAISESRRKKIINLSEIKNKLVILDGYNVLITVESICRKDYDSLVISDDCVLRDLNAVFGKYTFNDCTEKALTNIMLLLEKYNPSFVIFFFDSPVSFSGKLANLANELMSHYKILGHANISKNVDYEIVELSKAREGIIASSDSVIIDKVDKIVDIPYNILKMQKNTYIDKLKQ
ncbi:DUF434 domain-containing protein [Methanobacterium oryzae]|uniref:DUF434 domain-containing protein n=1 Tax=Methanobacterium oryzae TaxID=69540 RepID=UPI003D2341DA